MLSPLLQCLVSAQLSDLPPGSPSAHNPIYPWKPPPEFCLNPKLSVGCCPSSWVPHRRYPFLCRPVPSFPVVCNQSSELHADPLPHGCPTATSAHLRNPQSTADVHPLGPASGGLQGSSSLGTEQALWLDTQGTRPAQPAARGHLEDPIACLGREQGSDKSDASAMCIWSGFSCKWSQPQPDLEAASATLLVGSGKEASGGIVRQRRQSSVEGLSSALCWEGSRFG